MGCGTYLSQVGICKKSQDYFGTRYHRKALFEVVGAGEELKLKGEKLRCKKWMQLAEVSWSPAKASDCNRCRLAFQGEKVSLSLALDSPKACIQEGA